MTRQAYSPLDMNKNFAEWYATLNADQRQRVDKVLIAEYGGVRENQV